MKSMLSPTSAPLQRALLCVPVFLVPAVLGGFSGSSSQEDPPIGYDDTPLLPNSEWRVHDSARPRPVVVEPGTLGAPP